MEAILGPTSSFWPKKTQRPIECLQSSHFVAKYRHSVLKIGSQKAKSPTSLDSSNFLFNLATRALNSSTIGSK